MPSPFISKMEHGAALTDSDRAALAHLVRHPRRIEPHRLIVAEGDGNARMVVVLSGWACRSRMLTIGQRQITDLLLPGDACHPYVGLLGQADHTIETLTACMVAEVDPAELRAVLGSQLGAASALWWSSLQVESMLRMALTNNGQRLADQRIAHLICEIAARLRVVGLVGGTEAEETFVCPLTQEQFGEITGLSSAHINRTFTTLRRAGLLTLNKRTMRVPDPARLATFCNFQHEYLHLQHLPATITNQ